MNETNNTPTNVTYRPRRGREPFQQNASQEVGMLAMVKNCFTRYADFSGRSRRSEYWYFRLFNFLIMMPLFFLLFGLAAAESELFILPLIIASIYTLVTFIPTIAVSVRRLHDTGRSGAMFLLAFIPVAGIVLLVFLCEDSKPGVNQWGPNPKGIGNGEFDAQSFSDF